MMHILQLWRHTIESDAGSSGRTLVALVMLMTVAATGCGVRPYRAMAKAATSEEDVFSQAGDKRLKMALREALVAVDPDLVLHVTPYAYMGHAYLVGFVDAAQRQNAVAAAQGVQGVRSLETYLPEPPADGSTTSDIATKAAVKAALALNRERVTQIDIEVLGGHVVLLGVVGSEQAIDAAVSSAQSASGVTGVTNFLLLPEREYEKRRPSLRE